MPQRNNLCAVGAVGAPGAAPRLAGQGSTPGPSAHQDKHPGRLRPAERGAGLLSAGEKDVLGERKGKKGTGGRTPLLARRRHSMWQSSPHAGRRAPSANQRSPFASRRPGGQPMGRQRASATGQRLLVLDRWCCSTGGGGAAGA